MYDSSNEIVLFLFFHAKLIPTISIRNNEQLYTHVCIFYYSIYYRKRNIEARLINAEVSNVT